MIFVTVGTHEQQFNRLIKTIDKMVEDGEIKEEVVIQKGYSDYEPKHCKSYKLIGYDEMQKYMDEARIVITHGGPSSFIEPLTKGKVPIVVPRKKEFNEHVNNHQVEFTREVKKRMKNIILAESDQEIQSAIKDYDEKIKNLEIKNNSNKIFNNKLKAEIEKML